MIRSLPTACLAMITIAVIAGAQAGDFVRLFDGQSLVGWEGNQSVFRVLDGAIVGGTLEAPIPQSEFLCTTQEFDDFELRLSARIKGGSNAGVQFRSQRVPGSNQVGGYQADMGFTPGESIPRLSNVTNVDTNQTYPLWGSLLDEYRPEVSRSLDIPILNVPIGL